jgi:hypothetical protein
MTPKEKAEDIYLKMVNSLADDVEIDLLDFNKWQQSFKSFALIAVDEILDELLEIVTVTSSKYIIKHINYYQEIKQEIEKL